MFFEDEIKFKPKDALKLMNDYLWCPAIFGETIGKYLPKINDMVKYYRAILPSLSSNQREIVKDFIQRFEKVKEIKRKMKEIKSTRSPLDCCYNC